MDRFAAYIIDSGWVFLAGWSIILLALSAIIFGPDLARAATSPRDGLRSQLPSRN